MKFDLQVSKKTFGSLIAEHNKLEIPDFQRPYEWEPDHWSDLWDDLTGHLDQDYLMGGIVLCGGDNGIDFVIDGQQRLSTITLVLAVCRDYLWRECESEKAKQGASEIHKDYIVSGGMVAESNEPYITLGEIDRTWFVNRIQVSPAQGEFSPPDLEKVSYKLPSSNRLLWKAYKFFYQQLKARHANPGFATPDTKINDTIKLTRQLAKRTWFVLTRVPDDTQAYTLFEVLNDRGLELSISDLIKNVILARASELQRLQKAKDSWADIVEAIDYENIASFIRYYWMSKNGKKVTENDLFPILKEEIKKMSAQSLVSFLAELSKEAVAFAEIIGQSKTSEDISRELSFISSYGFKVGNTVLLAAWASTDDEQVRLEVLKGVKNFLIKFAVFASQVTNKLESVMAEIAWSIRKDLTTGLKEMKVKFKKELPSLQSIESGFMLLEPSISVARSLLVEIECYLAGTEKIAAGPSKVNVEHIFPQSPNAQWRKSFNIEEDAQESYIGRLGNMTLLDAKLNKQASNKPYSDKQNDYYSQSDFTITKELLKVPNWTAKLVDKRQAELYIAARKIWDIG
jgi:hypothetical protein